MKYGQIPIGLETYSIREDFQKDPKAALQRVKTIGYDGVEFYDENYSMDPTCLKELLAETGLSCYGILTSFCNLKPETLEKTLHYNETLGNRRLAIGSLSQEETGDRETLYRQIDYFNELLKTAKQEGFTMGYHCHAADFRKIDGKTIWDHIFENTPEDFLMVLDTGNALAGGGDPLESLLRYPHRQEWMHIKPYSHTRCFETGYDAMVGEDDFDWKQLIKTSVETGGCQVLTVEYGSRGRFQPFYGAHLCYENLKNIIREMDE